MSAIDAAWLRMDRPTNLAIITSVLWFARPPDWEAVSELLRERLVDRFPRFRQRAVEPRIRIGMPRWEDDPRFDLRRHVHRHRLPAPGDQGALEAFVGTLQSTPLDRDKPLWSAHLVEASWIEACRRPVPMDTARGESCTGARNAIRARRWVRRSLRGGSPINQPSSEPL
jgi:hypothetical protein